MQKKSSHEKKNFQQMQNKTTREKIKDFKTGYCQI